MIRNKKFKRVKVPRVKLYDNYKDQIIATLKENPGCSKSRLIAAISGMFWTGYASPRFIYIEKQIKCAFDDLVYEGKITYVPREPLILNED